MVWRTSHPAHFDLICFDGARRLQKHTDGELSQQVFSSLLAAWTDTKHTRHLPDAPVLAQGYVWMTINVLVSAAYVLYMRKRIKVTNFKVRRKDRWLRRR